MIVETLIVALGAVQRDWPQQAELRQGEVIRSYQRTMSRRGTFERIVVFTPTKVFVKEGEKRYFAMLSEGDRTFLKELLLKEPEGLRGKKRENPMWPSAYDGTDQWMTYRIGRSVKTWTNEQFEFPTDTRLGRLLGSYGV